MGMKFLNQKIEDFIEELDKPTIAKTLVRIIYCFCKNDVIILHGFIKKTQKIPRQHIELARKYFKSIDHI